MTEANQMVIVIDDDLSARTAIKRLVGAMGFSVKTFGSGQEFLYGELPDEPSCLILDVRMPGLSGLDVQRKMKERGVHIPIIFITGHGDVPMSVQAMKAGAVDFLIKPFRDQDLLDAIWQALERDRAARQRQAKMADLQRRHDSLTPCERKVMTLVVGGLLNKQIAAEFGVSEKTIKVHRSRVMQKMRAECLAELVRIAERLGVNSPKDYRHWT
jgi:FixJ family two-component response regulator